MGSKDLIALVEAYREDCGMPVNWLLDYLGVSKSQWSRLRNGQRQPSISFLKTLKEKLPDLTPQIDAYIAGLTEPETSKQASMALRGSGKAFGEGGDT